MKGGRRELLMVTDACFKKQEKEVSMAIKGSDTETCKECRKEMHTYGHRKNSFGICHDCMVTKQHATWKAIQLANNGYSPERG